MTISMEFNNKVQISETLALNNALVADPTIIHVNSGSPYRYATGIAWSGTVTLAAGVYTLDLTALARSGLSAIDATTYELRALYAIATSTNTNLVTIKPGAANPYGAQDIGLGLSLMPGVPVLLGPMTGAIAVDATHKNIDFASAMAAATVKMILAFGPP